MKLKGIFTAVLSAVIILFTQLTFAANEGTLIVHVEGLKSDSGVVRIAMYNSPQAYQNTAQAKELAFIAEALPIKGGQTVWKVEKVPYGTYGIKLFHDVDLSGKLKKSFVGKPTEGIGFSNNPRFQNRAPTFDEVKFVIDKPVTTMAIHMINL